MDDLRRPNPEETLRQMPTADLIERAHAEVHALCNGRRRWTMTVPPEPLDSDLLFTEVLDRLAAAESQREALRAAIDLLGHWIHHDPDCGWWRQTGITFCDCGLAKAEYAALKEQPREPGEEG